VPIGPTSLIDLFEQIYDGKFFYQLYFQEPGVAEAELGADHARSLRTIYFGASGQGSGTFIVEKGPDSTLLEGMVDPDPLPDFVSAQDIELYAAAYATSGWHGPINRYRAQGLDAADIGQIEGGELLQPAAFIGGELDSVRRFMPGLDLYDFAPNHCKDFRGTTVVPGAGHWVQQEAPEETNAALDRFLDSL
jgi:pimeloyl-ACP methyl ester carboxylesterase